MLFSYHLLYFCTALSLIIMLSSHYHHHKSKTFSQLTQCPFTGTLLLLCFKMSEKQRKCSICLGDMLPWDNHQACLKCRNDKKGKDKCVIGKESECTICAGALKIPHRKKSSKSKVTEKFDDSLLDEPTPSKSSTSTSSTPDSSLQEMLKAMNNQLSSVASQFEELKRRDKPTSSKTALPPSQEQGMCAPVSQTRPVPSEGDFLMRNPRYLQRNATDLGLLRGIQTLTPRS